jgi:hypothetical protein
LQSCKPSLLAVALFQAAANSRPVICLRSNATGLFSYLSGAPLPQVASAAPYAHWGWKQEALAAVSGYNCTLAWKDLAHALYYGDATPQQQADITNYATWSADALYGWGAFSCNSQRHHYICSLPAALFPCQPPPVPPPPPPQPPTPPLPPSPPNCAPPTNASFVCFGEFCYGFSAANVSYDAARQACSLLGGDLVQWRGAEQQQLVERHMRGSGALSKLYYWQGIRRGGPGELFMYTDGSEVPQVGCCCCCCRAGWLCRASPCAHKHVLLQGCCRAGCC